MYAKGQNIWKTWKRRYFLLIQVSIEFLSKGQVV